MKSTMLVAALAVVLLPGPADGVAIAQAGAAAASGLKIEVLSNRADLISGGDALVEVELPGDVDPNSVRVDVDGSDVTSDFAVRPNGRYLGLVTGLKEGDNVLTARAADGRGARITLVGHDGGGPIFAGPQVQPWNCTTSSQGLGPPLDAKCNVTPVVTYQYKPVGSNSLQAYDPANPPSNVDTTTTDSGKTVPFIVRVEKGSMDRGIYGFAALYDPSQSGQPWAQDNWDHKVWLSFGGDCNATHTQPGSGVAASVATLGRGFAQINNGLFTLGTNCNEVVAAEALMMLKERVVETLGPIRYTISDGCSGGSMMQLTISDTYPGLLDGINPSCTYPDQWTTWIEAVDCGLLVRYYTQTSPYLWGVAEQQSFVNGHMTPGTCAIWSATYAPRAAQPASNCNSNAYNAQTNPSGERCSLADYQVAIWGRRPPSIWSAVEQLIGRGFANRPLDNVGVQYGLRALQSKEIVAEQFVDLNEKIGGYDIDFNWQPQRMVADPGSPETAYRAGRVTGGGGNLPKVAIIDVPGLVAAPIVDNAEFHTAFRSRMLRARIIKAGGNAQNHVLRRGGGGNALDMLDRWMRAVEADTSDDPLEVKIARDKPADVTDDCAVGTVRISDDFLCRSIYPYFGDPRIAAGGPFTDDIIKCQLKPLSRNDFDYVGYGITFTDQQWTRLQATFPTGVCDYTKPGVGEQKTIPWPTFADGPGGRPLGPAPSSQALALSDLAVSSLSVSSKASQATFSAALSNLGAAEASNVVVRFLLDGAQIGADQTVSSLASGASTTVTSVWSTKNQNGTHTVQVVADPAGAIEESSEANNAASATFVVEKNKIKNGSFEQSSNGTSPDAWSSSGPTGYGPGGSDGTRSVSTQPGGSWSSEPVPVTPGAGYQVSVQASGAGGTLLVQQLAADGTVLAAATQSLLPTALFQPVGLSLTTVAGAAQVRVVLLGGLTGTTSFDEVQLVEQ